MTGEYISNRILPLILQDLCIELGIDMQKFSEDWLVSMEKNGKVSWAVGYIFDLNSASAGLMASDKVAAYLAMTASDVPAVVHILAKSRTEKSVNLKRVKLLESKSAYVAKPLMGSSGKLVKKLDTLEETIDYVNASNEREWTISPWLDIVSEQRIILLDGKPLASYQKTNPTTIDSLKLFNLFYGAVAIESLPTNQEITIARRAVESCGLRLGAVDIITTADGHQKVLEINSGISTEHFARQSPQNYSVAKEIYRKILLAIFA